MKKYIVYCVVVFSLFVFSCNKQSNQFVITNKKISVIVDEFAKENKCETCIHEIYIDKKAPKIFEIVLYKGTTSLTEEENYDSNQISSIITNSNGIEFKVFSGVEHYLRSGNLVGEKIDKPKISLDTINYNKEFEYTVLVVKDSFGIISKKKYESKYPFMASPLNSKKEDVKMFFPKKG
jgi:hypothetical protein